MLPARQPRRDVVGACVAITISQARTRTDNAEMPESIFSKTSYRHVNSCSIMHLFVFEDPGGSITRQIVRASLNWILRDFRIYTVTHVVGPRRFRWYLLVHRPNPLQENEVPSPRLARPSILGGCFEALPRLHHRSQRALHTTGTISSSASWVYPEM